ncbi:MAG: IS91 family transposase [bacterium]|nr:IS91 family transposase [bacterium]
MARPSFEVADVIRQYGEAFLRGFGEVVSSAKRRVMRRLTACRTAALGGHIESCDRCDYERIAYNSCRDRHCPKCQASARAEWVEAREGDLLPVPYFHVVFTVPPAIAAIALQNKKVMYGILIRAAADTLLQIAADPKHLGAEIGVLSVLHTWGQTLTHHPHVHCVVPGGGLDADRRSWIACRPGFFLPVAVLSAVFRGKFLDRTRRAFARGELKFQGRLERLADPENFARHLKSTYEHRWIVYSKPPFGGAGQVLRYLARYTHRVAIANSRIVAMSEGKVSFRYKDYAHGNRPRTMTLAGVEFLRRFLQHVLPKGFVRIRSYGFLANSVRARRLEACRTALGVAVHPPATSSSSEDGPSATSRDRCPACKVGTLVGGERLPPFSLRLLQPRAPPIGTGQLVRHG